ncbi:cell division protein [Vibrio thalassae]|uniref:Cell division protein n=1 Tax=Vibrio thalassae TaxID=1243014 RepID=A0A240E9F4_9VIBR|nr:cellulose synthase operon protein YhjQ/BcsQ [Vibrio thalassae]SNX45282.1 cell division protein [Vibrio thalassae]
MSVLLVKGIHAGAGANSVAANLAAAYTVLGHKVLLIDLDRKNLTGPWFAHSTEHILGWTDAIKRGESWKSALMQDPVGTYFLPHGSVPLMSVEYADYLLAMLNEAKNKFEIVIILAPHDFHEIAVKKGLSLVLNIVNPTPSSITQLHRFLQHNTYQPATYFVLNQCRHDVALSRDMTMVLEETLGTRLISAHLYFDIAIQEAFAMLGNVMTAAKRSNAAVEFRQLATVLLSQVEKNQLRS